MGIDLEWVVEAGDDFRWNLAMTSTAGPATRNDQIQAVLGRFPTGIPENLSKGSRLLLAANEFFLGEWGQGSRTLEEMRAIDFGESKAAPEIIKLMEMVSRNYIYTHPRHVRIVYGFLG